MKEMKEMAKSEREYRSLNLELRDGSGEGEEYIVTGYASTFEPYVVCEYNGLQFREQVDKKAFNDADLTDVVFRVDHDGKVYARTSAGTVKVEVDNHGLRIKADLSKTASARELYEEIKAGNYNKMSFAFVVEEDSYNESERLRVIRKIKKLYDVSPVSFPANPGTELSARSFFDGVIKKEKAERLFNERKDKLKKSILKEMIKGE